MYKYQNVNIGEIIPFTNDCVHIEYIICYKESKTARYTPPKCPQILYHYTNVCAFRSIILKKNIFLGNLWKTNDKLELKWFLNLVHEEIRRRALNTALYLTFCTLEKCRYLPFYFSFSELKDNLDQWMKYGANGNGIAIGFYSKKIPFNRRLPQIGASTFVTQAASLLKIDYAVIRQKKEINAILDNVVKGSLSPYEAAFCLAKMSFACKSPDWSSEKEWRVVCAPEAYGDDKTCELKLGNDVVISSKKSLTNSDGTEKIIREMKFQPTDIAEVIIGPKNQITVQEVEDFLKNNGYDIGKTTNIFRSNSPLQ